MLQGKQTSHEKLRKNPRALMSSPASIVSPSGSRHECLLVDVSVTGAKIKTGTDFFIAQNNSPEFITFLWSVVPGVHPLKLDAKVLWKDKKQNLVGVEWIDISLFSRKVIQRVVYFHRS